VTEVKSGPGFRLARNSQLVAVMRRDGEKAKDYAERHQVPKWYNTLEGILTDPEVDAIYVATPPGSHLEVAREVARHGKPCYLEKPMARNLTESLEIAEIFESAKLPLFVAYYRRCYARFLRLKKLLESQKYGKITAVHYRMERLQAKKSGVASKGSGWRENASISGGGFFVDVGSHALDLLDFLLGPLEQLSGVAVRERGSDPAAPEEAVTVSFACAQSEAIGTAIWNFHSSESCDILEITTAEAKIVLPEFMNGRLVSVKASDGSVLEEWEEAPPSTVQLPMIQSVTDAILEPKLGNNSTAAGALRTARYIDDALSNFYGGRGDAFWTRVDTWPVNSKGSGYLT